jgi:hypothetical protein
LIHLFHCFTSALKPTAWESFDCCLSHFRTWSKHHLQLLNVLERILRPSCELLYLTNTSHCKQETFLYEYRWH